MTRSRTSVAPNRCRCAIYTRKSTEEGLEKEFNTLDAQRESAEAYIKSQAHEGWECLTTHYDDGGFTGGNMDRPALRRLLVDIEAGKIDCAVVYKVDRLSRSLLDFARMMEIFEKHHISFVSVTQQINSANSMGRLMLNVLLSFAQFEREIISERTRDKIAAARRKGKWSGGHPILGYDIDLQTKLILNPVEATQVKAIFALYLEHQSLLSVVQELERRGWRNKRWITRKGHERGGKPFNKTNLHKLLTNVAYLGKVRHKLEIHAGEHEGIVDPGVWQRVQSHLQRNGRSGGEIVRNQFGALLKGLIHCTHCTCAMTPSHCTKKGKVRYRYYVCVSAQKRGWSVCPAKSIPAGAIEKFVVERIACIGKDPALLEATLEQIRDQQQAQHEQQRTERHRCEQELCGLHTDLQSLVKDPRNIPDLNCLADLQERIRLAEQHLLELRVETGSIHEIDTNEVARVLSDFEMLWKSLTPREQTRLIHLLVNRIDYDGVHHKIKVIFHPTGILTLAQQLQQNQEAVR